MSVKQQVTDNSEVDENYAALITNAGAVRALTQAVEGTIGPKGLDTMLVDQFGDVVITNDGVTILDMMDVSHPAARMLIKIAKSQQEEIGDGTTTATIMAGALVAEGVAQVLKGVPVVKVIAGMRIGLSRALELLRDSIRRVEDIHDPLLKKVALVAGRDKADIAELVFKAACLEGRLKLLDEGFRFSDCIKAREGAENQVISGVLLDQEPLNTEMPKSLSPVKVMVLDDALEPEGMEEEALTTESGFKRYLQLAEEFRENLRKIVALGVNLVLVDRGVHDEAEEVFTEAGILVLARVPNKELRQAAEHTGAKLLKRTGLKKSPGELAKYLGEAQEACFDERLRQLRILGGKGKPQATVLVGASTEEVVGERERIAKDAAAAIQAAVRGGIVPGGGSVELAIARKLGDTRQEMRGMLAFGLDCVVEALKRPFSQIITNAGFNPLEKLGDLTAAQAEKVLDSLGLDCDSGEIVDLEEKGIYDPALVKEHALIAAGEVAEAILRIDTIIKKKAGSAGGHTGFPDPENTPHYG